MERISMSKLVRVINNNNFDDFTPQDLIHRSVNNFYGWKCSAGSEGLFIDWDGNVWPATCEVGRKRSYLGSLNDDKPIKILNEYITCFHKTCPCLIEIYLPKYKDKPEQLIEKEQDNISFDSFDAVTRASNFDRNRKYIMWAFGRKCNFSCSYCDDNSHSKKDSDLVTAKAINKALDYSNVYRNNKSLMWSFTGGEPTINPLFLTLVKELKSKNDTITVATNGSQSNEYYKELAQYANINISVHFEFLKSEKLKKVTEAIIESSPDWFGLNFMILPGKVQKTKDYIEKLLVLDGFKDTVTCHFDILRKKNSSEYELYSPNEIIQIEELKNYKEL